MSKKIAILGSTGSIGTQTLDVVAAHSELFEVVAIAAGSNIELVRQQILAFRPKLVSVATEALAAELRSEFGQTVSFESADSGLIAVAEHSEADLVVTAVVGTLGLRPTIAALNAGKHVALANKETLVAAGHIVTELATRKGLQLLPVDSEHSAVFQCIHGEPDQSVRRILLTASGGPFRDRSREEMKTVKLADALKHPNWSMGAKVTIDSATLMNKGLEVMEAHWLFGMPYEQIEVIIHPQSIVHSMVEFQDRSVLAQLGTPDMRLPIQYALSYPERLLSDRVSLDLLSVGELTFRQPDLERFPILAMAYTAGKTGGSMPAVLNAANEVAVDLFLREQITFLDIESILSDVMEAHNTVSKPSLDDILHYDAWARRIARELAKKRINS